MALAVLFELVRNKEVEPFGDDSVQCFVVDGPAEAAHSVVGKAVIVDKIEVAVVEDCTQVAESILKCQQLKHRNHLLVEDYVMCVCIDIAYLSHFNIWDWFGFYHCH